MYNMNLKIMAIFFKEIESRVAKLQNIKVGGRHKKEPDMEFKAELCRNRLKLQLFP